MKDEKLPNHLRAWRKAAGFTQVQVETMLHWQHSRLSHLENGSAVLNQEVLDALGPIYAKDAGDLLEAPPQAEITYQPIPRARKKSAATLSDGVAILQQLMGDLQAIKSAHAEQLTRLERQVKHAAITISEAIQDTDAMTERWQQDLAVLRQAVRPSAKKTSSDND